MTAESNIIGKRVTMSEHTTTEERARISERAIRWECANLVAHPLFAQPGMMASRPGKGGDHGKLIAKHTTHNGIRPLIDYCACAEAAFLRRHNQSYEREGNGVFMHYPSHGLGGSCKADFELALIVIIPQFMRHSKTLVSFARLC